MSWLFNSMEPEISGSIMMLKTAKEVWTAVTTIYSSTGDAAQGYEFRKQARETTQKELSLISYFATLNTIWQQLDFFFFFLLSK